MLTPDRDEILRYLGYRGAEPDPETENSIDECLATLLPELQPREIHRFFPLQRTGEHSLRIEGMEVTSRALSRSLRDCEDVCLFAATIGFAPDRLAARFSAARKMSRAVIIQALMHFAPAGVSAVVVSDRFPGGGAAAAGQQAEAAKGCSCKSGDSSVHAFHSLIIIYYMSCKMFI